MFRKFLILLLRPPSRWILKRQLHIGGIDIIAVAMERIRRQWMEMGSGQLERYKQEFDHVLDKVPELGAHREFLKKALDDAIFLAKHREKYSKAE